MLSWRLLLPLLLAVLVLSCGGDSQGPGSPAPRPTSSPATNTPAALLPDASPPPDFVLPQDCRRLGPQWTDGQVLAYEVLSAESDGLLLDNGSFDVLAAELTSVVQAVRKSYPVVAHISARVNNYVPAQVVLGLAPGFAAQIEPAAIWTAFYWPPVTFHRDDLDDLNRRLGVRALEGGLGLGSIALCVGNLVNIPVAAREYAKIPVVKHAEPNHIAGDGPDIAAARQGGEWYIVFRDASGDCPSGCISQTLYYFRVRGGIPTQISQDEALGDPAFHSLVNGWQRGQPTSQ